MASPTRISEAYLRRESREARLERLGYSSYEAYIGSPRWAATRRNYFEVHPAHCALCPAKESLILHHRTYERVGDERLEDLIALCQSCHAFVHGMETTGYIDTLDPEKVQALSDADRQRHNRALEEERKRRQQGAPRRYSNDAAGRLARSCGFQLRKAMWKAIDRDVDISDEIVELKDLIRRIRTKKR